MGRIEEITERLNQSKAVYIFDGVDCTATDDVHWLLSRLQIAEEANQNLKRALHESHTALAMALLKNGGSMDFNYHDFFELGRKEPLEFVKHENYHNDSVTISIKNVKP